MWTLLPLLGIPIVVMTVAKIRWSDEFTVKEFLLLEVLMVTLMVGGFFAARWGSVQDVEKWNGRITAKDHGSEHCCHCHEECDTCTRRVSDSQGRTRTETYRCHCREVCRHPRDYWWSVSVSTGDRIVLRSCEPDKHRSPKEWDDAYIGEPASVEYAYSNYLLADPDSVFRQSADVADVADVPPYPRVHSHYKADQAIDLGTAMDVDAWNAGLREINADLGAGKQINVIVIAAVEDDPRYADAVEQRWLYGKKNDLIFVLGADGEDADTIAWARVVTISRVEGMKIAARDEMPGMKLSDHDEVLAYIRDLTMREFERTPMADFEYLMSAAKPKPWMLWVLYLTAVIGSVVGSILMVIYDPFGDGRGTFRRRFPRPRFRVGRRFR